jgi:hypothetical protein
MFVVELLKLPASNINTKLDAIYQTLERDETLSQQKDCV